MASYFKIVEPSGMGSLDIYGSDTTPKAPLGTKVRAQDFGQATAWAQGTAYVLGQRVLTPSGTYVCTTAGTSAASGTGPTGTAASGIVDNTAQWGYTTLNQLGENEFEYVKFSGTVAAGDLVKIDRTGTGAGVGPICAQSATTAAKGWYGIAMGAQSAGTYGWVCIRGCLDDANALAGAITTLTAYGSALTAGRLTNASTANYIIDGLAINGSATTGNRATAIELFYPYCSGR